MRRLRPLLLGTAAAVFTVSCAEGPQSPVTPAAIAPTAQNNGPIASAPPPENSAAKFEQDFMMDMIDHHEMAIQMAQICLEKAVHEELRATCENIIGSAACRAAADAGVAARLVRHLAPAADETWRHADDGAACVVVRR